MLREQEAGKPDVHQAESWRAEVALCMQAELVEYIASDCGSAAQQVGHVCIVSDTDVRIGFFKFGFGSILKNRRFGSVFFVDQL